MSWYRGSPMCARMVKELPDSLKERGGQREPLPKALWDSPDLRPVDEGRALRALSNIQ